MHKILTKQFQTLYKNPTLLKYQIYKFTSTSYSKYPKYPYKFKGLI